MDSHLVTYEKIQEQSTSILINCIQSSFEKKKYNTEECKLPRNIYRELFKRLITPFYLPVLILISLLLILTTKENLKYKKNKYLVFFIGFGIIILSESSLGYITSDLINNIKIFILPVILIVLSYFIFIYKLKLSYRKL
jgi:lipopolysaccharide export system permease protein